MAGKVIPGPVVCLLLRGGFVVDVGEVTVEVVNLDDEVVVVAVVVDVIVEVVVEVVVVVTEGMVVWVFGSDILGVGFDF